MRENGIKVLFYPVARYTTHVNFQQSNRPCGYVSQNKKFISEQRHVYGSMTEVSVLANRIAIGYSISFPVLEAYILTFRKWLQRHRQATEKEDSNGSGLDKDGGLCFTFPSLRIVLRDKDYSGLKDQIRIVILNMKPVDCFLHVSGNN